MPTFSTKLRVLPTTLILFRFAAGPFMVAVCILFGDGGRYACASLLALGVLSDIFDGVIARRVGCVTPSLRKLDSRADVAFWLCTVVSVLIVRPQVRASLLVMGAILFIIEWVAPVVSLLRFGQEASTHHILSKIFGLGLWGLMTTLLLCGPAPALQLAVFGLGAASQVEAIAIMLIIPAWRTDIRGLAHALRLRDEARRASGSA